VGPLLGFLAPHLLEIALGVVVGAATLAAVTGVRGLFRRRGSAAQPG
jgi:hypothetical protein